MRTTSQDLPGSNSFTVHVTHISESKSRTRIVDMKCNSQEDSTVVLSTVTNETTTATVSDSDFGLLDSKLLHEQRMEYEQYLRDECKQTQATTQKGKQKTRCKVKKRPTSLEEQACQRSMANIRERSRTQSLNEAFGKLRTIVPCLPQDKMSKIRTLQLASDYIKFLDEFLQSADSGTRWAALDSNVNLHYAFSVWRMETCNVQPYWYPSFPTTPAPPGIYTAYHGYS